MHCIECGNKLSVGQKFCSECGALVAKKTQLKKSQVATISNYAAASLLGIFIPILGIIFGLVADSKARKILDDFPDNRDVKRAQRTATIGAVISALLLVVGIVAYLGSQVS